MQKSDLKKLILSSITVFGLVLFSACAHSPSAQNEKNAENKQKSTSSLNQKNWESLFQNVLTQGKNPEFETIKVLGEGPHRYQVRIHNSTLYPLLQFNYQRSEIEKIEQELKKSLSFSLDSRGLARAADRVDEDKADETHYDAVWVRDSLWVYLGLKAALVTENKEENLKKAKTLLLTLAHYFSSADQNARFQELIKNPKNILGSQKGMTPPHIRFDRNSSTFQDVQENGKSQVWNHKQNDALGLFLELFCKAILNHEINESDLNDSQKQLLITLPQYFAAIRFYEMEDAGSWEEIERVNTSSIALVTSGLEKLDQLISQKTSLTSKISKKMVKSLINSGYQVIKKQINLGGESPQYSKKDAHYRTSDAALLNLIYPAELKRLKEKDYQKILKAVDPLIGDVGIRRYLGDSYQSGNFWFNEWIGASEKKAKTDDTSSSESFENRGKQLIKGSEAQWFFDSWYAIAMHTLSKKYKSNTYRLLKTQFLNRALAQVTGGSDKKPVLGADGLPVGSMALPESYNTLVDLKTSRPVFAPSPITPLNWAKACMRIALTELAH